MDFLTNNFFTPTYWNVLSKQLKKCNYHIIFFFRMSIENIKYICAIIKLFKPERSKFALAHRFRSASLASYTWH